MRLGCSCGAVLDSRTSTVDGFAQKIMEITKHIDHQADWVEDNEGVLKIYSKRFIRHTDKLRGILLK